MGWNTAQSSRDGSFRLGLLSRLGLLIGNLRSRKGRGPVLKISSFRELHKGSGHLRENGVTVLSLRQRLEFVLDFIASHVMSIPVELKQIFICILDSFGKDPGSLGLI